MSGSGTGGALVIALGCCKMTIKEAENFVIGLCKVVSTKDEGLFQNIPWITSDLQIQADRVSSLREVIHEMLNKQLMNVDIKMSEINTNVKV